MRYVYWGSLATGKLQVINLSLLNNKKICRIKSNTTVQLSHFESGFRVITDITSQEQELNIKTRQCSFSPTEYHCPGRRYFGTFKPTKNKTKQNKSKSLLPFVEDVANTVNQYEPDIFIISDPFLLTRLNLKKAKHFVPYKSSFDSHTRLVKHRSLNANPKKISVGDYSGMFSYYLEWDRTIKIYTDVLSDGGYDWEWFNLDDFGEYKKFNMKHSLDEKVESYIDESDYQEDERFLFLADAAKRYVEEYRDELTDIYPLMK